jgi:enamine deaminase RidA (YjgF/YER057c/UK114 family)
MSVEKKLKSEGYIIPVAAAPVANYVGAVRSGNLVIVSGQLCFDHEGKLPANFKGKLGGGILLETGQQAARFCAINILAQVKAVTGSLDLITRCIRLGGFINATPDFEQLPQVMNGASDFMVLAFGEAGRHARSTIGVSQLPMNACVEVEALFEIKA